MLIQYGGPKCKTRYSKEKKNENTFTEKCPPFGYFCIYEKSYYMRYSH